MTREIDRLYNLIRQLDAMATELKAEVNALHDAEVERLHKARSTKRLKGPDIPALTE